jgi:hypothetical protein
LPWRCTVGAADCSLPPAFGTIALFSTGCEFAGLSGGQFVTWFCALGFDVGGVEGCATAANENPASRTINADLFMADFRCFDAALAAVLSDKPHAADKVPESARR